MPYAWLNPVQSACFHQAFESEENMLVVAPTGSGKTGIFELAIAKLFLEASAESGSSGSSAQQQRNKKALYMAPLKALIQERREDWGKRFALLNLRCVELTSDTQERDGERESVGAELMRADVILTTPEKWDSVTRKWKSMRPSMSQIRLVCVDEIHTLNEESRGPTLEAVLTRMKAIQTFRKGATLTRFVVASATIPNPEDVAEWLHIPPNGVRVFGPEHRPVPLATHVVGYAAKQNAFLFERDLRFKVYDLLVEHHGGRPALVFCSTRKSVTDTAQTLLRRKNEHPRGAGTPMLSVAQSAQLAAAAPRFNDQALAQLVRMGLAYYHSGLSARDRTEVSRLYMSGDLRVVCTTSALALGINLPAYLVVVVGTQMYRAGGYQEIDELSLVQMIGRAGRPQFDTQAVAVIMTEQGRVAAYRDLVGGRVRVVSKLEQKLAEHINSEIVLETIQNLEQALVWLQSTFFFVTALRWRGPGRDLAAVLQDTVVAVLRTLAECSVAQFDEGGIDQPLEQRAVAPRPVGVAMSKHYVAFETMKQLVGIGSEATLPEVCAALCRAAEFQEVVLRRDEKAVLNELNKRLRFPLKGRVTSAQMKVQVILQARLGQVPMQDHCSLNQEAQRVLSSAPRILRCAVEVLAQRQTLIALHNAMLLLESCSGGLWFDSERPLQQLHGIGAIFAQSLSARGVSTFEELSARTPGQIEEMLRRNPPFGSKVLDDLRQKWSRLSLAVTWQPLSGPHRFSVHLALTSLSAGAAERGKLASHTEVLVGDYAHNQLLCLRRMHNSRARVDQTLEITLAPGQSLHVHALSDRFVGMNTAVRLTNLQGALQIESLSHVDAWDGDRSEPRKNTQKSSKRQQQETHSTATRSKRVRKSNGTPAPPSASSLVTPTAILPAATHGVRQLTLMQAGASKVLFSQMHPSLHDNAPPSSSSLQPPTQGILAPIDAPQAPGAEFRAGTNFFDNLFG
ncbi:MAG: DEAD/DEAH box helicase [archaeon]|nr:DEAD/DEAH box helicase [archaeon]